MNTVKYFRIPISNAIRMSRAISTTARAVTFPKYGEPDEIANVISYNIGDKIGPNEVLVKTLAATINPSDINQIQGVYPSRPVWTKEINGEELTIGGNEGVFEVVEVGSDVKDYKKGDWTLPGVLAFGTWRSHALVDASKLSPPLGLNGVVSPLQIVTSNINPVSAYQMLKEYVELKPGDWVIQNGGNSAVGRAVIQLAKLWGYKTISVVRSRPDIDELIAELKGLGADVVLTEEQAASREYEEEFRKLVGPDAQIKLALNCVGGKSATSLTNKLSVNGHHVTYGAMSKQPVTIGAGPFIFKNITFHGYWLSARAQADPVGRNKALKEILGLVAQGKLQAAPALEHKISADKTDAENTEIARKVFKDYSKGFSNKKHVFQFQ
ncbi:hypothetical protein DV451_000844 [Geotrichum candidum]|uniref:enoyl-[acyl-carrier-protein] reductase n=1 Tax=Geotrichum candidum TaxID=1173061 RepID=A0A0J9X4B5_GEOCN|nr:hypothetical protein DV451_000844 [Geotrichum candidum]KAF5106586.1 hypothetical protein DV453_003824 [Geotrichum candidum]CDO51550.1 similar to Saccharomyces cerevisiae YBR026C ETR1 2-enoyl thioester reductase [Geotrichum candidum]